MWTRIFSLYQQCPTNVQFQRKQWAAWRMEVMTRMTLWAEGGFWLTHKSKHLWWSWVRSSWDADSTVQFCSILLPKRWAGHCSIIYGWQISLSRITWCCGDCGTIEMPPKLTRVNLCAFPKHGSCSLASPPLPSWTQPLLWAGVCSSFSAEQLLPMPLPIHCLNMAHTRHRGCPW